MKVFQVFCHEDELMTWRDFLSSSGIVPSFQNEDLISLELVNREQFASQYDHHTL